jgi:DNA-binding NarL/FixJ family response regulator
MSPRLRLLIADDHAILREGLRHLLAAVPHIEVAAETTNGAETIERLKHESFDLLLLDWSMPGLCGDELVASVRARHPALPILILTMHNELQVARQALAAGASGYLTKDNEPEMLVAAIVKVAAGKRFLDPVVAEQLAFAATGASLAPDHAGLTGRELEVLRLLAGGATVNEIASRLAISNKTVSTHKARLMEKMGFSTNADLFKYAVTRGLVK